MTMLASSVITQMISVFVERRLGQATQTTTLAGMLGVRLLSTFQNWALASVVAALGGGVTMVCYKLLIRINNLCTGVGGSHL